MAEHEEELLRYYWEELTYLRKMGQRFARRYPKVASRLELEPEQCPDPHVERLIESFAFLTGRIQRDLDADFPEIAQELLNILYPQFLLPVPSLSIARFEVDPDRGKLTTGFEIPRHTPLFAAARHGRICRFRTCYPVELWPVEVTEAAFESPDLYSFLDDRPRIASVLRLRLVSRADPIAELEMRRLRFFLNGDPILICKLYELILNDTAQVAVVGEPGGRPRFLPGEAVQPVGFGVDEEVLPYPRHAHPAFRLLQEYFVLPEAFYFFDLAGLDAEGLAAEDAQGYDVLILLERQPDKRAAIDAETFALGCTPIVNLFTKTSEPIRVDHRKLHYRLVPDQRRESTTEIHSIQAVTGSSDVADRSRAYEPFYSFSHAMAERHQKAFWHAKRVPSQRQGLEGSDVLLSFLDLEWQPSLPPDETVYAHTLCTNRELAGELPSGAILQSDEAMPVGRIVCLKKPTRQIPPPLDGATLWRLVSHLSLNYLSLSEGGESLKALQEILRLYSIPGVPSIEQQIAGVRELSQRKVMRRIREESWRGFCRGTEITLTFDESLYVGSSAFLFASVLNHFFALYTSTNSFTEVVIKKSHQRLGVWKRWPPMAGEKIIL